MVVDAVTLEPIREVSAGRRIDCGLRRSDSLDRQLPVALGATDAPNAILLIPHELAGIPIFGFGWLLGLWILVSGLLAWRTTQSAGGAQRAGRHAARAGDCRGRDCVFLIPRIEEPILPGKLVDAATFHDFGNGIADSRLRAYCC
ncbi:MAG: hypothetical protein R3C28_01755 [Pirellulaceae bacterium]